MKELTVSIKGRPIFRAYWLNGEERQNGTHVPSLGETDNQIITREQLEEAGTKVLRGLRKE